MAIYEEEVKEHYEALEHIVEALHSGSWNPHTLVDALRQHADEIEEAVMEGDE